MTHTADGHQPADGDAAAWRLSAPQRRAHPSVRIHGTASGRRIAVPDWRDVISRRQYPACVSFRRRSGGAGRGRVYCVACGGREQSLGVGEASPQYMGQQAALCGLGSILVFLLSSIDSSLTVTNDRYLEGVSATTASPRQLCGSGPRNLSKGTRRCHEAASHKCQHSVQGSTARRVVVSRRGTTPQLHIPGNTNTNTGCTSC